MVIKVIVKELLNFRLHIQYVSRSLNQTINYYLRKYYRSNQKHVWNQRPVVWAGEKIFWSSNCGWSSTTDGELV